MEHSDSSGTGRFPTNPRMRITTGDVLSNTTIIDLVAAADHDGFDLLSWDGKGKPIVAPVIDYGGTFYQPAQVDPTIRDAIMFPRGAVEYGTDAELFAKICTQFRDRGDLPEDSAALATSWTLSSWVPELLLIPMTMCITGALTRQICNMLRLCGPLCRRALAVAQLSPRLPLFLNPTLLINDPTLSPKQCASWQAANWHGMFVAGPGNTLSSLCCSKAVVLQPGDSPQAWGEETMLLVLPPSDAAPLTKQVLADVANELQPQLEMFRLRHLSSADPFVSPNHPLAKFDLARHLGACIPDDPDLVRLLTPLLELHRQDSSAQQSRDPRVAILEAVWTPLHDSVEITVDEILKRINAILLSRGANREHNARELGWKLRNLALSTSSNGRRKVLRFSDATRSRIHRHVRDFRLQLPFREACEDCRALQATNDKQVK